MDILSKVRSVLFLPGKLVTSFGRVESVALKKKDVSAAPRLTVCPGCKLGTLTAKSSGSTIRIANWSKTCLDYYMKHSYIPQYTLYMYAVQ